MNAILAELNELTRLKWLSAPPAWITFLVILGAAVFSTLVYLGEHSAAGRGRRLFLATLRVVVIASVWVLLGELVETTTREEVRPSTVVVMIDESVSMTLRDAFSSRAVVEGLAGATGIPAQRLASTNPREIPTRLELVKQALSKDDWALVRSLTEKSRVRIYAFSKGATPLADLAQGGARSASPPTPTGTAPVGGDLRLALEKVAALEATGPETAIGDCLNKVLNETRGDRIAGIVLITDGRSNSGVLPPLKVARRRTRGIPLYTVGVGNPDEPKDIALSDLQAAGVVIAGDVLPVKFVVKSQGFEGEEGRVEVVAKLDDETLKTEPLELIGKGARQDVGLRLKPEKPGEYTLSIEIPPRPGELDQGNNRLTHTLRVIDKKIKVLYVDGRARYDFRFLKWALIRDKNMEVQTFQCDADPEFIQDCSPGVQPLNEVPKTAEDLRQYHVVILGDVDPHDANMGDERLKLIHDFVEERGGGLYVIAGQQFMPRAYAGTPLESLLPVVIDPGDGDPNEGAGPITEDFRPKLTLDGRRHPIMQLENDPERNRELWEGTGSYAPGLPGFFWYYRPKERNRAADVLAVHPEALTARQEAVPIFAVQTVGAGSVFFQGTDEIWRWRAGVENQFTYRLWGQAIRNLSTGRLLKSKRFSIRTDKADYDPGEKIVIEAEVNDRNMKPATDETQSIFLKNPDGQVERVELARLPRADGNYRGERTASKIGKYRVWIGTGANPEKPAADEDVPDKVFYVRVPVLETSDPKMDEELLRALASNTGGKYFPMTDIARVPSEVGAGAFRQVAEVQKSERELWDRWWVLCSVAGLLSTEWLLRKWWKML